MYQERAKPLSIEHLPLSSLRLDPQNPRQHNARQIGQISRSIDSFGFNVPILVDRDNKILAGHGRVQALQRLGRTEAPVIRLEHLTPAQAKAFNLADNRLTEVASWNDRLLGEVLQEFWISVSRRPVFLWRRSTFGSKGCPAFRRMRPIRQMNNLPSLPIPSPNWVTYGNSAAIAYSVAVHWSAIRIRP
jgi:hypothetical protein